MTFQIVSMYSTIVMPNPLFSDSEANTNSLNVVRSVNGKRRTYIKSTGRRRKLRWNFRLTRNKALELREYMKVNHANRLRVIDHNNRIWEGYIITNPIEFVGDRRGAPGIQNLRGETWTCEFEFDGFEESLTRPPREISMQAINAVNPSQLVRLISDVPGSPVHNWDAESIIASDGAALASWADLSSGNTLNAITGRQPTYSQFGINTLPCVSFNVIDDLGLSAMKTSSNTALFPSKRGVIFCVLQYSNSSNFLAASPHEFSMFSITNGTTHEQVHLVGGSNSLIPFSARMGTTDVMRLGTSSGVVQSDPFIFMIQRENDNTLRWRFNGIEKSAITINNDPGVSGTFYLCETQYPSKQLTPLKWGQVLTYGNRLSSTEIDSVESHLSEKWGIPLGVDV